MGMLQRMCWGLGLAAFAFGAANLQAQTVGFDVDFSGDTEGNEPATDPNVPPYPGTKPTSVGYFTYVGDPNDFIYTLNTGAATGFTHTVEDVAGFDNALRMTTGGAGTLPGEINFVDFQFNTAPTGQIGVLEFDLAMLAAPGGDNAGYRADWEVVVYNQGGGRATGIYASHNVPGTLAVRGPSGDITLGSYTIGEADNLRVEFNLTGGTFDAYLNGVLAANDVPYIDGFGGPSEVPLEFFIQQPVSDGGLNQAAFDNFSYVTLVPEPASVGLFALSSLALLTRRRIA